MSDRPVGSIFPRWANGAARAGLAAVGLVAVGIPVLLMLAVRTPYVTGRGIPIEQPVAFDHRHHVVDDGIDCRYCHQPAESTAFAGVPSTSLCMNCHNQVWKDSPALAVVRASAASGAPIPWRRVHTLPDFVYFNHSAHVMRGVGCASCHGRVDRMARVYQDAPLTMGWCLDCHRHPEREARPLDRMTDMDWTPDPARPEESGAAIARSLKLAPPVTCSGCHR